MTSRDPEVVLMSMGMGVRESEGMVWIEARIGSLDVSGERRKKEKDQRRSEDSSTSRRLTKQQTSIDSREKS